MSSNYQTKKGILHALHSIPTNEVENLNPQKERKKALSIASHSVDVAHSATKVVIKRLRDFKDTLDVFH